MSADPVLAVFGAGGQLGRALMAAELPAGWRRLGLGREIDITDAGQVERALGAIRAGVVVNAAAWTAVDHAETEPDKAFAINRDGARGIAMAAAERGLATIHLSTDYVFDGAKRTPYAESDAAAPLSIYGASKLAGEEAVRRVAGGHLILRTSWLFGLHGRNFVRTILRLSAERDEIRVVDDQIGCPTFAGDLAAMVTNLAPHLAEGHTCGLFHCCGDEPVSWHGLAKAVLAEAAAQGMRVPRLVAIPTSGYPLPALRPAYSALSCAKLHSAYGIPPSQWRQALRTCVTHWLGEN